MIAQLAAGLAAGVGLSLITGIKPVVGNHGLMFVKSVGNGGYMTVAAADAFKEMVDAAAQDGVTLMAGSAFRSPLEQAVLYAEYVARGFSYPTVAKPGISNHGNGSAIDIAVAQGVSVHYGSQAYNWLMANAGSFGFSWTEGRAVDEPWHWVYVG